MVGVVSIVIGSILALSKMKIDIFPSLNLPVIYVCQPYGGMTPQQMEGLLTSYYEFHFLYVSGIHHIESKNIQSMTLLKLYFHPNVDMASSMGEVVAAVNRAKFMMPPGTVPPFVSRVDTGNASIGYLVLSSESRSIKDIQDMATLKVRPMFANIPGMSSPPAFGGNQRAIVINLNLDQLRSYNLTPEAVLNAVAAGNSVTPTGNARIGDQMMIVQTNAMAGLNVIEDLKKIPITYGPDAHFLHEVATIKDDSDIPAGYVLVNGKRSVYMLVTKRSDASTMDVVHRLKKRLPLLREQVPEDVKVEFAFDQSPIVSNAISGVAEEAGLGAILTGLMVMLFLRDWRTLIVVVLNIPLAILAALIGLWLTGNTINLMTLGGLALAVGILVDEATVEVENIHTQMSRTRSIARAVRKGNSETAVPRFLALLCILAVFLPSAFMEGAAKSLFVPLSLSVGFAMIASYLLSSSFVPVLSTWILRPMPHQNHGPNLLVRSYGFLLTLLLKFRYVIVPIYLLSSCLLIVFIGSQLGQSIFPVTDRGQFQLRMRLPTGTRIERTEEILQESTNFIRDMVGKDKISLTVGYVGLIPTNYPVQALYQWTNGPEEFFLKVALTPNSGIRIEELKNRLRKELPDHLNQKLRSIWDSEGLKSDEIEQRLKSIYYSFEPADIINEVMSFGSPTPVEIGISGPSLPPLVPYSEKLNNELKKIPQLLDLQLVQPQDYPTIDVQIDRQKAALSGVSSETIANSLVPATASSRYIHPLYWRDPISGQAYIVQVQVPIRKMNSVNEVKMTPVYSSKDRMKNRSPNEEMMEDPSNKSSLLLRDISDVSKTRTAGAIDRYNMRRYLTFVANVDGEDLGRIRKLIEKAIAQAGNLPRGATVDIRGQLEPMDQIFRGLAFGLFLAIVVIFLLLTAYFQSIRLSLIAVSAVPACLFGVVGTLYLFHMTINLQSFMGAIMSIGVAVANAILLVTFAEVSRKRIITHDSLAFNHSQSFQQNSLMAALEGATSRLRPIIMTSCAMIAGMLPMATGFSEGGDQSKPLAIAVIGGLSAATFATLFLLPGVFAILQKNAGAQSASLDPDDPNSPHYDTIGTDPTHLESSGPDHR